MTVNHMGITINYMSFNLKIDLVQKRGQNTDSHLNKDYKSEQYLYVILCKSLRCIQMFNQCNSPKNDLRYKKDFV